MYWTSQSLGCLERFSKRVEHSNQSGPLSLTLHVFKLIALLRIIFFPSMIFCGEAAKKTSIDGLKWRDLVMGRWWLVNFNVSAVRCPLSGVTKGFMC